MSVCKFFTGFIVGGLVGGLIGVLLAPSSGDETRGVVVEKSNEAYKKAESSIKELQTKAEDVIDEIQQKGDELLSKVQELLKQEKQA